jgi:hypothetical protein
VKCSRFMNATCTSTRTLWHVWLSLRADKSNTASLDTCLAVGPQLLYTLGQLHAGLNPCAII